jgi:Phycobilisome protein
MSFKDDFFSSATLEEAEDSSINELSKVWAKRYIQSLVELDPTSSNREQTASQLFGNLRSASARAWMTTENVLAREVRRHKINSKLIDPWEISKDAYYIYEKALSAYAENVIPRRLSVQISADLGSIRNKWTNLDPRVISFVSMQFHHTGKELISDLPQKEQFLLSEYFKVIDDHLYMPLQRAYDAAAEEDYNSPELSLVQQLLPLSGYIAQDICKRVIELYPNYQSASGLLSKPTVRVSSLRDVEMFQVYLWVCVLEKDLAALQQELFPLCLMLYPTLNVSWELVRQMIHLMGQRIHEELSAQQVATVKPYIQALWAMFSPQVLLALKH